jgi:MazG family protein
LALVVVPLAPDEVDWLTLREWDLLTACERVLFEHPDHPLVERLRAAGVECSPFDDEPIASLNGWSLVADPDSKRLVELAREGAYVTAGASYVPDGLTAAHAAPVLRRAAADLGALVAIMARLRSEDGCPWDREQTHESLKVHLLEETYEVLEAIEEGQTGHDLEEELGDLLLQVAFHSRLAELRGSFDIAGVASSIVSKLVHRHPHVFGSTEVSGATEVVRNWEAIKAAEKGRSHPFEGIPSALPALLSAYKTQKRAAGLGFAASEDEANDRVRDSLSEVDGDVGEALFWLVAVARSRGVDPEGALRAATERFRKSFD